jgi:hypothetical protein
MEPQTRAAFCAGAKVDHVNAKQKTKTSLHRPIGFSSRRFEFRHDGFLRQGRALLISSGVTAS